MTSPRSELPPTPAVREPGESRLLSQVECRGDTSFRSNNVRSSLDDLGGNPHRQGWRHRDELVRGLDLGGGGAAKKEPSARWTSFFPPMAWRSASSAEARSGWQHHSCENP